MMGSAPTSENRIRDELWLKNMRAIGIRIEFVRQKWPDLLKMARAGQLQMWQVGWSGQSADQFMQLCYGPSGGEANMAFFKNAEYDELYRKSRSTPTDTGREPLYARMTEIVAAYAPMGGGVYRMENTLLRPVGERLLQGHVPFPAMALSRRRRRAAEGREMSVERRPRGADCVPLGAANAVSAGVRAIVDIRRIVARTRQARDPEMRRQPGQPLAIEGCFA